MIMKTRMKNLMSGLLLGCAMLFPMTSCEDSNEPMGKGEVEFEITDAPTDDPSVKGVFVTVADLKVDGESVPGFTRQTIDLKAYQEGKTWLLAAAQEFDARTYNNITLVLDLDQDASGAEPGCYVLSKDNVKYKLQHTASGTLELTINKSLRVIRGTKATVVIDFDLRKSVVASPDAQVKYRFGSNNGLKAAIRVVDKDKTGTIKGSYTDDGGFASGKVIVYAYRKGTFNAGVETQAQGEDGLLFANAVSSAEVKQGLVGKVYTLAWLEEGEYELHFAAYEEDASGRMKFATMLSSETSAEGSLSGITVKGGLNLQVTSVITGNL
jgi:hypothetical protein